MTSEAFAERVVAMQETLYRVAYSLLPQSADREDAVQACILRAWQRRDSLRAPEHMQTWVIRILINECYAIARKRQRETLVADAPTWRAPPDADARLHDLFLALEERLRLTAVLYYIEDYSVREIATITRVPVGTVKSRLARARERMREEVALEEVGQT